MIDRPRRGSDRRSGGRPGRGGHRSHRDERPAPERPRLAPYPERPRPSFSELFRTQKPLIGVVHLKPLPGSPGYDGLFLDLLDQALSDARAIEEGGAAGLIVENFGDAPFYPDQVPPETVAAMTRLVTEIRKVVRIPVGVNVLRNDARAGVAVAAATGAGFIRVNVHTGVMVTDQGLIGGRAWESVRLRETLRSRTLLFADIRVKHGAPLVPGDLLREAEDTLLRGLADALIVTGASTGAAADLEQVRELKRRFPAVPVIVGSGVDLDSAEDVFEVADGCIVGTGIKEGGRIDRPVDPDKVRVLAQVADRVAPRMVVERFRREPPPSFAADESRDRGGERDSAPVRPGHGEYRPLETSEAPQAYREAPEVNEEPVEIPRPPARPHEEESREEVEAPVAPESANGPQVQFGRALVRKKRR